VALCNRGYAKARVTVRWSDIDASLTGYQPVRNSWLRQNLGLMGGGYTTMVPAHGTMILKVGTPQK
jgi:hypothetical protein